MSSSTARRTPLQPITWMAPEQRALFEAAGTTAHRIASGSGGWLERLGDDAMISHKNDQALKELLDGLENWSAEAGWKPARVFTRFLPLKNDERISPVLHSGDATLPIQTVVTEAGIRYGLDFGTGYSHGLFLDQRGNRAKLRAMRPKRMLNTFAYTCSFSVVAALTGAETLSVDLSRKSLDRGRQNFALNGIDEAKHRFTGRGGFSWSLLLPSSSSASRSVSSSPFGRDRPIKSKKQPFKSSFSQLSPPNNNTTAGRL